MKTSYLRPGIKRTSHADDMPLDGPEFRRVVQAALPELGQGVVLVEGSVVGEEVTEIPLFHGTMQLEDNAPGIPVTRRTVMRLVTASMWLDHPESVAHPPWTLTLYKRADHSSFVAVATVAILTAHS